MKLKNILEVVRAGLGTQDKHFTSAIIAAAGSSTRFGENKQMQKILDVPVLIHTLRAYEASDCIDEIIIVTKKEDIEFWKTQCELFSIKKITQIIEGGKTRQESTLLGFEAIDKKAKFVAIADGARCLVTPMNINDVCFAAYEHNAATAAHKATDTIKIARAGRFIESSPDRETIWAAQTPQVFKANLYRAAAYTALKEEIEVTDDNSLVEFIGHPIYLVECGAQNIKITTKDDVIIAESILQKRKDEAIAKERKELGL